MNLIRMKESAERRIKAYLSERKSEFHNRGTITKMTRDAHPKYLLYSHIKVKPRVDNRSTMGRLSSQGGEGLSPDGRMGNQSTQDCSSPQPKKPSIMDFRTLSMLSQQNRSPPTNEMRNQLLSNV